MLWFSRQEVSFARIRTDIRRQNMVNWTTKVSGQLEPLIDLIERAVLDGPVIQLDETPVKVLKLDHTGRRGLGRMWLALGGTSQHRAVRYKFAPGRGKEHAKALLGGRFHGFLQTDGCSGYETVLAGTDIRHVLCWAEVRRRFLHAEKSEASPLANDALSRIGTLYERENACRGQAKDKNLTDGEFLDLRQTLLKPYLSDLKFWMERTAARTLPSSKTGEALAYTLGRWDKLELFLNHPWLTLDNDRAENAMCPFVAGRKNWLFHLNDAGAEASCRVYTLIETSKLNGVEPYGYLQQVLTKLPATLASGDWEALLPWNLKTGGV
jgi:hypothetical protein